MAECEGMAKKAVVLLSGGLDSATVLALVKKEGWEPWALSFSYGQKAQQELDCAGMLCKSLGVQRHIVMPLAMDVLVRSALISPETLPRADALKYHHGIPETYVPGRNLVFLSLALGLAESIGAHRIFIGANSMDYSGYPDCRPEFLSRFNSLACIATAQGVSGGSSVQVEAPLMHMTKAQIIQLGLKLGVDYSITQSCYSPDKEGKPCGFCESCKIRMKGFEELGEPDPLVGL